MSEEVQELRDEIARLERLVQDKLEFAAGEIWVDDEGDLVLIVQDGPDTYPEPGTLYRCPESNAGRWDLVRKVGQI